MQNSITTFIANSIQQVVDLTADPSAFSVVRVGVDLSTGKSVQHPDPDLSYSENLAVDHSNRVYHSVTVQVRS